MDCQATQKKISAYIDGSISDEELAQFIAHVKNCPGCADELEIYYTIEYMLHTDEMAESGKSLDMHKRLMEDLKQKELYLARKRRRRVLLYCLIVLGIAVLALLIFTILYPDTVLAWLYSILSFFRGSRS